MTQEKNGIHSLAEALRAFEKFHENSEAEMTEEGRELLPPLESHLRDFIAQNMRIYKKVNGHTLGSYVDEHERIALSI